MYTPAGPTLCPYDSYFLYTGALARTQSYSYRSSSTILLTRGLDCRGIETNWLDCNLQPQYSSTCSNGYTNYNAGVQCSPGT